MNRTTVIPVPNSQKRARARVSELETLALAEICRVEGVKFSEGVRIAIREAAKARGLWPPVAPEMAGRQ